MPRPPGEQLAGPRLCVFCGLPGTGKSTLAAGLARHLGAAYLRVDAIRDGLFQSELRLGDAKDGTYCAARSLAAENLALGRPVVADAVHWTAALRHPWTDVAARARAQLLWIETLCSDPAIRQARIEARAQSGRKSWRKVGALGMDPVEHADIRIETCGMPPEESLAALIRALPDSAEPGTGLG
ncbi:AAA family ATPase [Ovoidimarina sediminis]|uniref:AAA family ATPase n=1 Tax=Ovoidimarina sediminis TaxID=3079856 RepID=UPI00290FB4CF|nr:ATP-binding protein [Rhodophyticola sp. MJ-SS7]MDU8945562.1 ATP-binding protein [Rhodophyticola sp. MJ-SS7]